MIDKSIMIIIFMYAASISFLTVEYMFVDVFHITVTNYNGDELTGSLITTWMDQETFNTVSGEIENGTFNVNTTFYNKVETYATAGAAVAWNFVTLLSGLYIFNLVIFLGVPLPFVIGIAILYVFLLARTIIGLLQRV
jgi:hypothetical protein